MHTSILPINSKLFILVHVAKKMEWVSDEKIH